MAIYKCKMCGGDLNVQPNLTVAECEYCFTKQTLPKDSDGLRANLFNRANHFRRQNDFDKAVNAYERILMDAPDDAEAHWGVVISRLGIEYVEDPRTHERIPTCHRVQLQSILDDADYLEAVKHAPNSETRELYQQQAARIAEIQKGILSISAKEEPYDVFICYKETDESGQRTKDSVLAQDIYYQLTQEGYKVFFSRITLEDKLGQQYEPYIFAALNSAKVMIVLGTKPEHLTAVWVKNEWSRYLMLTEKDRSRLLIPCYCDMDAYDLPEALSMLQSQDMSKIGFIQDLIRGITKVIKKENKRLNPTSTAPIQASGSNATALLRRVALFLEDKEWDSAKEYCEKILDIDPENAEAYLGKMMAKLKVSKREDLKSLAYPFDGDADYKKVLRFGDDSLIDEVKEYNNCIIKRCELKQQEYQNGIDELRRKKEEQWRKVNELRDKWSISSSKSRSTRCDLFMDKYPRIVANYKHTVGLKEDGTVVAVGDNKHGQCNVSEWTDIVAICASDKHTVGLKEDGTVVAVGDNEYGQCNVSEWTDIVAICASDAHTVALKSDGTVVAVGGNYTDQCNVSAWKDIVAIRAGNLHTVALKSDGTVVAVGDNYKGQCNVSGWKDIVAICADSDYTIGLKANGTVVAVGDNYKGQRNLSAWKDIVAIHTRGDYTVGLKADGTVVAVGIIPVQRYVSNWKDIVAICASNRGIIGLKSDGTVVESTNNDTSGWKNIVAIYAGLLHTVGLKNDGTVVAVGYNNDGQCNAKDWHLFDSEDALEAWFEKNASFAEDEREKAAKHNAEDNRSTHEDMRKKSEEQKANIARLENLRNSIQTELSQLRGLFTGKRRRELEEQLAEIDYQLKKLKK